MVLYQIAIASVAYGLFKLPRIRRRSCVYILGLFFLLVRPMSHSSFSFCDLNLPPAGNNLYLPHYNPSIHRDLAHGHRTGDAHLKGSKGSVLPATERARAMRRGVPARFAHPTVVRLWAVWRPRDGSLFEREAEEGGGAACECCTIDACDAGGAVVMSYYTCHLDGIVYSISGDLIRRQ